MIAEHHKIVQAVAREMDVERNRWYAVAEATESRALYKLKNVELSPRMIRMKSPLSVVGKTWKSSNSERQSLKRNCVSLDTLTKELVQLRIRAASRGRWTEGGGPTQDPKQCQVLPWASTEIVDKRV